MSEKLSGLERNRLAQESTKLSRAFEQSMAEEGMSAEAAEWPEY